MTWIMVSLLCNTARCWWVPTREKPFGSLQVCQEHAEILSRGNELWLDCVARGPGDLDLARLGDGPRAKG